MSRRTVGFLSGLMWALAIYFFAVSRILSAHAEVGGEQTLVTALGILAGGFVVAAVGFLGALLVLGEETRMRGRDVTAD